MNNPPLRQYQRDVIEAFNRRVDERHRRVMLVAPTGAGKTVIGAEIIGAAARSLKPVLVLAHRREIIEQTSCKLYAAGIGHGIIQAGFPPRPLELVQVASIQTLWARAMYRQSMDLPHAHLLVVDEAHHCPAKTYAKIIKAYPEAVLLGLTATPCRGDGRGLGGIFDTIVECPQVADLIAQGYLVRTRVYAPVDPDLKGVRTVAGDYVESQLAERMDTALAQVQRGTAHRMLRRVGRSLHPHPRRVSESGRARRTYRRFDAQGGARCCAQTPGFR